jgi:adenosylcobinamide-GDP ribazoletransferase
VRSALAFLTMLGRAAPPDRRALVWFPVVGAAIGGALGLLWVTADEIWAGALVAALVVAVDLGLTGLLHVDGLADAADGLLPPLPRERRLAVMATPDVGAFAVAVVAATLLTRFAALATAVPDAALLGALWCASRAAMAVTITTVRYARESGLASGFAGAGPVPPAIIGAGIVVALAVADPLRIVASVAAVAVAFAAVVALGVRRLGGYTGDVLGAAGIVGETVGLVVAAARW